MHFACEVLISLNQDVPDKYFLSPAAIRKLSSNLSPDRRDSAVYMSFRNGNSHRLE